MRSLLEIRILIVEPITIFYYTNDNDQYKCTTVPTYGKITIFHVLRSYVLISLNSDDEENIILCKIKVSSRILRSN